MMDSYILSMLSGHFQLYHITCADPEGRWTEGPDPLINYKNIGFLSNIGSDPLKIISYKSSILCWAIIGPPVKRHINGVSLAGR